MNRSLLKAMSCILVCFSVCLIKLASKAESQVRNSTPSDQANYKLKQKTKHTNPDKSFILVPPPPPTRPSLLDWSGFGDMTDTLGYLNTDELNTKLEHVRKQITSAKLEEKEVQIKLAESKDKAERFHSLYTEGVVSRKELESAEKEAVSMERSADDSKNNISDLEIQETAIIRQLSLRKRNTGNAKNTHRSHLHNKNTEGAQSK